MLIKKNLLLLAVFFFPLMALAQTGTLRGTIKNEAGQPVPSTQVKIQGTSIQAITDSTGFFEIKDIPFGTTTLLVGDLRTVNAVETVDIKGEMNVVTIVARSTADETLNAGNADIPTVSLNDEEVKEAAGQSVSSVLTASRDAFTAATSFIFSSARYRIRGYEDENFINIMNGAVMTDMVTGRNLYNSWTGLNDVMRSRDVTFGLNAASYSFGGVGGAYNIDSRAARQRKQLQVTYSNSNRAYDNRLMLTYGSGVQANGWSYSISYSRRWAQEGFIPGTFYDGHSFFASVEKEINSRHDLALTVTGASTINGRSAPAVREMQILANDNYYNPNWGYQDGQKRNAVVGNNFQPLFILTHDFKISDRSNLESAISYQFGKNRVSGLDWFNAADPRPDFYRYLPSFDPSYGDDPATHIADSTLQANYMSANESARQIQWDVLYNANQLHDTAKYVISDRVADARRFGFNTIYNNTIDDNLVVSGGLTYLKQDVYYYRELKDLLGAKYYINLNQFAEFANPGNSTALQNDANNPNRRLVVGDKYGYDYEAHIHATRIWGQAQFKYDRVDYFVALTLGNNAYYRVGNYQNGIFLNNSLGKSAVNNFLTGGGKTGVTYKYNGRNYFFANLGYNVRAPFFENVYISPRTRDYTVNNLTTEKITSLEGGYIYKSPRLKGRAVAFYTQFTDGIETKTFYHGDYRTFVNYSIYGIGKRHTGLELALDANLGKGFSAQAVVAAGQFIYSNRPQATITQDNRDTLIASDETIFWKNCRVSSAPQNAYTLGIRYSSRKFWWVNVNFNLYDHMYVEVNPARRTIVGLDLVEAGSVTWNEILQQERLNKQFTTDISAGWSWRLNNKFKELKRPTFLVLNLGISNVLDNTDLITTAFEQLRFDNTARDITTFPAKYSYGFGRTYFANLTFRFN